MITLVTGSPGAGKTLWTVREIVEKLIPTGRPIVTNIDGFTHDAENVTVVPPDDDLPFRWQDFEDGTIFIFDEVQRHYPPRHATAKVPPYISGYQTHRHHGFDFYFITQGPKLIDRALWDLTEQHVHLFRALGMKRSRIYRWFAVNESPQPPQTKGTALASTFAFPPKFFQYYKSASLHTDKRTVPWKPIAIIGASLCAVAAVAWMMVGFFDRADASERVAGAPDARTAPPCRFSILGTSGPNILIKAGRELISLDHVNAFTHPVRLASGRVCLFDPARAAEKDRFTPPGL